MGLNVDFTELQVNMVDYEKIFATKNYQVSLRSAWKIHDRRSVNGFILEDPANPPFWGQALCIWKFVDYLILDYKAFHLTSD